MNSSRIQEGARGEVSSPRKEFQGAQSRAIWDGGEGREAGHPLVDRVWLSCLRCLLKEGLSFQRPINADVLPISSPPVSRATSSNPGTSIRAWYLSLCICPSTRLVSD